MGNLLSDSLKNIWQNGKFNHFRENYRDTCGNCDLWTIDQVDTLQPQQQEKFQTSEALNTH